MPAGTLLDSHAIATKRGPLHGQAMSVSLRVDTNHAEAPVIAEPAEVDYRRRAVVGGVALVLRQSVVKGVAIVGGVVLARILTPEIFGTYAIVVFVVTTFSLVGDMGLGAALIQQPSEPTDHNYRVVFTIQLVVFGSASAAILVIGPWIAAGFGISPDGILLMRLLAIGLMVSALRTLPAVRLERHLEFGRLVLAEAAQAIVFQVVAVAAALSGLGVVSFGIAAVAGTAAATVLVNVVAPWRPGLAWDWNDARGFLRFGLPYQAIGVVSFIKDAVNPLFIGVIAGVAAVGFINWATVIIGYPLLISTILTRLYFPAFSRLRSRPQMASAFGGAVIRWSVFIAVGLTVPFLPAAGFWTTLVFGSQWLPAVPLLYLQSIAIPFAAAAAVGLGILNATGRSGIALGFASVWMGATWLFTIPAVLTVGWVGFGVANAIVTLTTAPFFYRMVERGMPVKSMSGLLPGLVTGGLAVACGVALATTRPVDLAFAVQTGTLCLAGYVAGWLVLCRSSVRGDMVLLRSLFARRGAVQ
jgi:O-antigen/teichoic acid export membrane protein